MSDMTRNELDDLVRTANPEDVPCDGGVIRVELLRARPIPHIQQPSLGAEDLPSDLISVIVYVQHTTRPFDYQVRDIFTPRLLTILAESRPRSRSTADDYRILRKEVAALAGLGQIGLNGLLFHPRFGFACKIDLVLSAISFDRYDGPDEAPESLDNSPPHSYRLAACETCHACADACPLGCPMDFCLREWERCDRFISAHTSTPETMCDACATACPCSQALHWNP